MHVIAAGSPWGIRVFRSERVSFRSRLRALPEPPRALRRLSFPTQSSMPCRSFPTNCPGYYGCTVVHHPGDCGLISCADVATGPCPRNIREVLYRVCLTVLCFRAVDHSYYIRASGENEQHSSVTNMHKSSRDIPQECSVHARSSRGVATSRTRDACACEAVMSLTASAQALQAG